MPRKKHEGPLLTDDVINRAQALFDAGRSVPEVAVELGLKRDTVSKAVRDGRLHLVKKKR